MKIYKAYYESQNFDFEAYSDDMQSAIDSVITGLEKHTVEYNLAQNWWNIQGIECSIYTLGRPYRDREQL